MTTDRPALRDTLQAIEGLQLFVEPTAEPIGDGPWLDPKALIAPGEGPLAQLLARFKAGGFAPIPKAASASLLLRFGWAAGFAVGAYFTRGRVPFVRDYALMFALGTSLQRVWIRQAFFVGAPQDRFADTSEWSESVAGDALRGQLLASLMAFTEPVVATQHAWSRLSRRALWAMAVSSWAAQMSNIARQLGHGDRGIHEARAMFALDPEIRRAAPELYEVRVGEVARTCQKRAGCCLWFKSEGRPFCTSCPIIPESERLAKNHAWVAKQPPSALGVA
jgi:FhuF 2Fe-2S C-terminal domain